MRIVNADLIGILYRQREFSGKTFGPGRRTEAIVDHIRKELIEIETSKGDLSEWIDAIILALDGAWRTGATPSEVVEAILEKQARNETRKWPDWRKAPKNAAIEHVREGECKHGFESPKTCPVCCHFAKVNSDANQPPGAEP